jgi:low affinity Fe/Cu permease
MTQRPIPSAAREAPPPSQAPPKPAAPSHSGFFGRFAKWTARASGHPIAFGAAIAIILIWAVTGPIFDFSDTWQLVINTGTTIITFLMVFLIQNTQNRETEAMQIKLDELLRASRGAHNALLNLEELPEAELERLKQCYRELAQAARDNVRRGQSDADTPEVEPEIPARS